MMFVPELKQLQAELAAPPMDDETLRAKILAQLRAARALCAGAAADRVRRSS